MRWRLLSYLFEGYLAALPQHAFHSLPTGSRSFASTRSHLVLDGKACSEAPAPHPARVARLSPRPGLLLQPPLCSELSARPFQEVSR